MRYLPMLCACLAAFPAVGAQELPDTAIAAADQAAARYADAQVDLLADLVSYKTVHQEGMANAENPEFRAFAKHLQETAEAFGLDFTDYGAVLVIGLGDATRRLGVVTHGDVQPADASKWKKSPFELDTESEPGRLIARGTEDDKAAIATALYAMKTIRELKLPLKRRIELIVALTEESDWEPFREVLTRYTPPEMNIGIDSDYPVVVAEKGWGNVQLKFASDKGTSASAPYAESISGGAFMSQVPEDAEIVIANPDENLLRRLRERAEHDASGVKYEFAQHDGKLTIRATGRAAHSSTPEAGLNAIAHAAALLKGETLAESAATRAVKFVNEMIGTGVYGKQFGQIAYEHDFMGPLTVNLSMIRSAPEGVTIGINTRAPAGKKPAQLEQEIRAAIAQWASANDLNEPEAEISLSEAYYPERAPQVEPLLEVFRHYTGIKDAQPVSIGGGTNARLLPNAVNFGPSMIGVPYTGHSEHEFITRDQMTLNLKMYTAMLAWLAGE